MSADKLPVPRRAVVALTGSAVALPLLAACGGSGSAGSAAAPASPTTPAGRNTAPRRAKRQARATSAPALASAGEVPVGGALVVSAESVVVTQPKAGQFRCFSSICTHAGCPVTAGSVLRCPCHGSEFSITDGTVLAGPATQALPERTIDVAGGEIRLA